jgi:hypothetical protein
MKFRWFFFIFFIAQYLWAQYPAHFLLGQKELSGLDIYNIIQDDNKNYYFATDIGILKYDGYEFEKLKNEKLYANSFFVFQKDKKGIIYAFNISHQIIKIENEKLEIFAEIPKEFRTSFYNYTIDHRGHLYFIGNGIIEYNPQGEIVFSKSQKMYFNQIIASNNSVFYYDTHKKTVTEIFPDGEVNTFSVNAPNPEYVLWIPLKDRYFVLDQQKKNLYEYHHKERKFEFIKHLNNLSDEIYRYRAYISNSIIWLGHHSSGVYAFDLDFNPLFGGKKLYEKLCMSIYEDHEGNTLLGMFDDAVWVIPYSDLTVKISGDRFKSARITSSDSSVWVCDTDGKLFEINRKGAVKEFDSYNDLLYTHTFLFWKQRNKILRNSKIGFTLRDAETHKIETFHKYSIKDVYFIDRHHALLAFQSGVYKFYYPENGKFSYSEPLLEERTFCISFIEKENKIYVGTTEGLKTIDSLGNVEKLTWNEEPIFATKLVKDGEKLLALTRKNGLFSLKNGQLKQEIAFEEQAEKLYVSNDRWLFQTKTGLIIYSNKGELLQKINRSYGLSDIRFHDFAVLDNHAYITNKLGILSTPTTHDMSLIPNLSVDINEIRINNQPSEKTNLSYKEKKISFDFKVNTLKYQEDVHYYYKLEGLDSNWNYQKYDQNNVTYNALAPGNYTFRVKSCNQGNKSIETSHSFTIESPYYQKWWFYLLCSIVLLSIITIIFRIRINRIRTKNEQIQELNKLKIIALQSQMNPHFIFNVLNSIQDMIMSDNREEAYSSIGLFAKMVRSILRNSSKKFLDFEDEIKLLKLYFKLIQLRFKNTISFEIHGHDEFELSEKYIPPMLIQPFVENALIHGLFHKKGEKKLILRFELIDDEYLKVIVEDNGIGRKEAMAIKSRQQETHKSYALDGISRRFTILRQNFGPKIGYDFEDLYDGNKAIGTRVIIRIPFKQTI